MSLHEIRTDVLDQGYVTLMEVMGTDDTPVQAARVSMAKGLKGPRLDEKLETSLMRDRHTSPFEHVEVRFEVQAPIYVARQWVRHRTANWNEVSGRYIDLRELGMGSILWHEILPGEWRIQDPKNKQGSLPTDSLEQDVASVTQKEAIANSLTAYETLLELGVASEQARTVLPLAIYTRWWWKIDLHNLLHFLDLRADSHAQREIQVYAEAMIAQLEEVLPRAMRIWKQWGVKAQRDRQAEAIQYLEEASYLDAHEVGELLKLLKGDVSTLR